MLLVAEQRQLVGQHRRGPTSDIDPDATWTSCGSSSRLHRRRNPPDPRDARILPVAIRDLSSGSPMTSSRSLSAPMCIVRNFTQRNTSPERPIRSLT